MTPQSTNRAIAELCGWKPTQGDKDCSAAFNTVFGYDTAPDDFFPNYHASLDACAEFEAMLTEYEWEAYIYELVKLGLSRQQQRISAPPDKRSTAFLRLKGKWVES